MVVLQQQYDPLALAQIMREQTDRLIAYSMDNQ
jgi:hypothetical protein